MENKLQMFENEEFGKVRVLKIEGHPWFVGKDLAAALGYSDTYGALKKHVDLEDRQNCRNDSFETNRGLTVVNESGLYSLILSSKLPTAKRFKRWVTSEVLPTIRQHGVYIAPDAPQQMLQSREYSDALLKALAEEQGYSDFLEQELEEETEYADTLMKYASLLRERLHQTAPKAAYLDTIFSSPNVVPVSLIAQDYGFSAVRFNRLLHGLGIQYKVGGTWMLYQKYAGQGYTRSQTYEVPYHGVVMHTYWTHKGRVFLYEILKGFGIMPLAETMQDIVRDASEGRR